MPPLSLHTSFARRIAERLRTAVLDDERGTLYLGATAPDIRVITRWERARTHFFDLENFEHQDVVGDFFQAYPALVDAACVSPATRAFIAGYVSHLLVDATWISHIYRPFFGRDSELGGDLRANILDRALQYSLDADMRGNDELMMNVVETVSRCDLDLQIDFIDRDTLRDWHRIISDFASTQPNWDGFRERTRKHLADSGVDVAEECEELARDLPDLVDETLRFLSRERINQWMDESLDQSVAAVREYLRCA